MPLTPEGAAKDISFSASTELLGELLKQIKKEEKNENKRDLHIQAMKLINDIKYPSLFESRIKFLDLACELLEIFDERSDVTRKEIATLKNHIDSKKIFMLTCAVLSMLSITFALSSNTRISKTIGILSAFLAAAAIYHLINEQTKAKKLMVSFKGHANNFINNRNRILHQQQPADSQPPDIEEAEKDPLLPELN